MILPVLTATLFSLTTSLWAGPKEQSLVIQLEEINHALENLKMPSLCHETIGKACPDVHVTPWCKAQFDFLKNNQPISAPSITKKPAKKRILFLGEEHGDEQAYSYYEKLLSDKEAGFDCLFLELPTVFQKNFDNKKGIVHDRGLFENLSKNKNPSELNKIELIDYRYIGHLESLVEKAKTNKVKVLLVDSSERLKDEPTSKSETMRRNSAMAKNIQEKFEQNKCTNAISIQGNMHLFVKDDQDLKPIDQILKETNTIKDLQIQKAFIYSPVSQNLVDAMGPCSWLNHLPDNQESYYSGKKFIEQNKIFPEVLDKALSEKFGAVDENIDYTIFLPLQKDKNYLLTQLNKSLDSKIPKKFSSKTQIDFKTKKVPLSLRTNPYSLGITNPQDNLIKECRKKCGDLRYKISIKDIKLDTKEIECQSFHPSRTGGSTKAPVMYISNAVSADCYCY